MAMGAGGGAKAGKFNFRLSTTFRPLREPFYILQRLAANLRPFIWLGPPKTTFVEILFSFVEKQCKQWKRFLH